MGLHQIVFLNLPPAINGEIGRMVPFQQFSMNFRMGNLAAGLEQLQAHLGVFVIEAFFKLALPPGEKLLQFHMGLIVNKIMGAVVVDHFAKSIKPAGQPLGVG